MNFIVGGDPSVVNLLDARTASDAILQWKGTITSNPVVVGYRFVFVFMFVVCFAMKGTITSNLVVVG
jgi:hypothetical protein